MKMLVGSVIFVLDKETHSVVPCRIVEIVSSVTLEGETTTHVIESPSGKKKIRLEDHDSPWFDSFDSARKYLLSAANKLVDQTMEKALKVAQKSFDFKLESEEDSLEASLPKESIVQNKSDETFELPNQEDSLYVDMAGQKVKVTLPKELSNV